MSVWNARLLSTRFALVPLIATAALGLAACGGDDDSGKDKVAVSDTDPCGAAVKEGGKLNMYSTMSTDVAPIVWDAFHKAYPDLTIEHTRASGDELIRRLLTEYKGDKFNADLFEANAQNVEALIAQGVTDKYLVKNAADFAPEFRDPDGAWTATRRRTDVVGYNTDLVKPDELPTSFEDLTGPDFKDKMIVEATNITDFTVLRHTLFDNDLDKTKEFWQGIEDNAPFFNTGAEETLSLLIAGQKPYYVGAGGQDIVSAQAEGAPVDFVKTFGIMDQSDMVIVKNAPHPNAARCFLEWVTSPEGQNAVVAAHYLPASPAVASDPKVDPPGITWYTYLPEFASTYDEDSQAWSDVFGTR